VIVYSLWSATVFHGTGDWRHVGLSQRLSAAISTVRDAWGIRVARQRRDRESIYFLSIDVNSLVITPLYWVRLSQPEAIITFQDSCCWSGDGVAERLTEEQRPSRHIWCKFVSFYGNRILMTIVLNSYKLIILRWSNLKINCHLISNL